MINESMNSSTFCLLVLVLISAAGCMPDLKSTEPPARTYWLETTAIDDPVPMDLRVEVVPGLDTDRLLILESDQRLNVYAGAFWVERLQPLLQSVLSRSLGAGAGARQSPRIDVIVERFFAVQTSTDQPPRVELRAAIIHRESGFDCLFEDQQTPVTARLKDLVSAHQSLVDSLTRAVSQVAAGGAPQAFCR